MKRTRIASSVEKNEAGGMISFVCRARKHVSNGTANDRSDDAEHNRPEEIRKVPVPPIMHPFRVHSPRETPPILPSTTSTRTNHGNRPTRASYGLRLTHAH